MVNPPNFSPRLSSALLLGVEKSGGDCVTLAAAADFGFRAVNASVHGESDAIDSRRKRRFIAAASVDSGLSWGMFWNGMFMMMLLC